MNLAPLFVSAPVEHEDAWAQANLELRRLRDELDEHIRIEDLKAELRKDADEAGYL